MNKEPGRVGSSEPTLENFIANDQFNLDKIRELSPHLRLLMPQIDQLYDRSFQLIPTAADEKAVTFARCFRLCHKGLLAAAVTIGRRHPDDAAAITRRAIETASLAMAVKFDPSNLERWKDYESRLARWRARREGKKPKSFAPEIQYPPNHAVLNELRRYLGILSDLFVHFTPEYEDHGWTYKSEGERHFAALSYVETNQRIIEREFTALGGIHLRILAMFDECYSAVLSTDREWRERVAGAWECGTTLSELFQKAPPEAESETQ